MPSRHAGWCESRGRATSPSYSIYDAVVLRPDESTTGVRRDSRCIELAGESPAAVSAGAPRSRPRAWRETDTSEWGVKSPQELYGYMEGSKSAGPGSSEPCSLVT